MQYSLISLFALVVAVTAAVTQEEHNEFVNVKRQNKVTQDNVPVNVAAMTNANGDVLVFDANNVYQDSLAKGI